jgi:hypothetical protein
VDVPIAAALKSANPNIALRMSCPPDDEVGSSQGKGWAQQWQE